MTDLRRARKPKISALGEPSDWSFGRQSGLVKRSRAAGDRFESASGFAAVLGDFKFAALARSVCCRRNEHARREAGHALVGQ